MSVFYIFISDCVNINLASLPVKSNKQLAPFFQPNNTRINPLSYPLLRGKTPCVYPSQNISKHIKKVLKIHHITSYYIIFYY